MALLAALLMLLSVACAEITLFDSLPDTWQEDTSPLQMNVTVEAKAMSEFDEPRLALLNDLLKHLSFEIRHQRLITENQSHVTVLAEGQLVTALGLQQSDGSDAMMQLSALPHVTYSGADPVTSLLGESEDAFFGLDETSSSWLEDGYQLLMVLEETLGEYCQSKEVNTTIEDMGRARRMEDYTVSKEDAPSLAEKLSAVCPEGPLGELLGRLVFSGKQTLRVYRTEAGVPLRVEYNGACGTDEEHLRTVHILWRLRRDDEAYRDELTLKSPALKGTDKNTITWNCAVTKTKKGTLTNKHISKHLHLPFQSGSDRILKSMNRHYTKAQYLEKIEMLRKYMPDVAITTDIMVGFPGETEEDFLDTMDVVKKVGFAGAFTFIYSKRKGTPAAKMDNQIDEEVSKRRIMQLIDLQNATNRSQSELYLGKTIEILCEGYDEKKNMYLGRDTHGRMAYFKSQTNLIGEFVMVTITATGGMSLMGDLTD